MPIGKPFEEPIRLGLIGCGGIVQRAHLPSLLAIPDLVRVTSIADVMPENLERVGKTAEVTPSQRFSDYRDLLAHGDIDAVIIATPHHLHKEQVVESAKAGMAVISEKPMATSLEEADAILEAVSEHQVPYTVAHNFLFSPPPQKALELLRTGEVDEPVFGRAQSLFNKVELTDEWRNQGKAGGGCLNDTAYHEIYLLENLMRSPVRYVEGRVQTKFSELDVDDLALLLMEHQNGAVSTVSTSWRTHVMENGNWCEVYSPGDALRVTGRQRSLHRYHRANRRWEAIPLPELIELPNDVQAYIGHRRFFAVTFQALKEGRELPISGAQAKHNLAIIDAARRATQERRAIEL